MIYRCYGKIHPTSGNSAWVYWDPHKPKIYYGVYTDE